MECATRYVSVDLVPQSWHRFEQWRRHVSVLALLALVVLGGGAGIGLYLGHRAAIVGRELARVEALTTEVRELRTENDSIDVRIAAVADAQARLDGYAQTDAWRRMLSRLSSLVPETILVTTLSSTRPGTSKPPQGARASSENPDSEEAAAPTVSGILTIEGLAADPIALNGFVDAIEADRVFRTVTLVRTKRERLGTLEGLSFSIVCAW